MKTSTIAAVFSATAVAICSAFPVHAQLIASRSVETKTTVNQRFTIQRNPVDWYYESSDRSAVFDGRFGNASVGGFVEFGAAKAFASGDGPGYYGFVESGWRDYVTVDAGALNGTFGTVTFHIDFDWTTDLSATGPGQTRGQVAVDFNGTAQATHLAETTCSVALGCNASSRLTTPAGMSPKSTFSGTSSVTGAAGRLIAQMPVLFGQPTILDVSLVTEAFYAQPFYATSSAKILADQTMTWGGTAEARAANGTVIPFAMASASGFDYLQPSTSPVPELPTAILIAAGAAMQLCLTRRRRIQAAAS